MAYSKNFGILSILSGQVKTLAAKQGVSVGRLDVESHIDQELDYHENRANLVKQFGLVEPKRDTVNVTRKEANDLYADYEQSQIGESVKAVRSWRGGNPSFKHISKQLWVITAKHSSCCPKCFGVIHAGEQITMLKGIPGWSHIVHAQIAANA